MLVIQNFINIEGEEFELTGGRRFLIGIAKDEGLHYTFAVFPLINNIASIKDVIVYKLHRALLNSSYYNSRGYGMTSAQMKQDVFVTPANLTMKNFILELHIQTAKICSQ
jgi:hypothetical protein